MTEAMPFLQKAILLSYDPLPLGRLLFVIILPKIDIEFEEILYYNMQC